MGLVGVAALQHAEVDLPDRAVNLVDEHGAAPMDRPASKHIQSPTTQFLLGATPEMNPSLVPSRFEIRSAQRSDVGAILAMIRALADYEKLGHLCVAAESDLERALFGPRPAAEVLLACKAGRPAAFALFFHNFSTFLGRPGLWLEDLFVLPEYRRQGCAQALLRTLAAIAVERSCGRFEWAVLDWNAPAIEFYRSLGATVLQEWRIVRVVGTSLEALAGAASDGARESGGAVPP
jgi:GNAT superfamily N-acetyltransferase